MQIVFILLYFVVFNRVVLFADKKINKTGAIVLRRENAYRPFPAAIDLQ